MRRFRPLRSSRDHEQDAAQTAPGHRAQEFGRQGLGLRRADRHAQDLGERPSSMLAHSHSCTVTETMRHGLVAAFT